MYLPGNCCSRCPILFFDYMVIHDTPHKPTLPQQRCRLSRFVTAVKRNNLCSNTYNFSDFSPCCSITFLPNVAIALTENPSSKCVPLSRPTRVLSVIPVTGAPILHGKATTPTHHHSLDSHRKAPTPSPNQLTYRPPGPKTVLDEYIGFQLSDFGSVISFLQVMFVFPRA